MNCSWKQEITAVRYTPCMIYYHIHLNNLLYTYHIRKQQNVNAKFDVNKLEFQAWLSHYKCVQNRKETSNVTCFLYGRTYILARYQNILESSQAVVFFIKHFLYPNIYSLFWECGYHQNLLIKFSLMYEK